MWVRCLSEKGVGVYHVGDVLEWKWSVVYHVGEVYYVGEVFEWKGSVVYHVGEVLESKGSVVYYGGDGV